MIQCFCTCDERDGIKTLIEKFMVLKAPSYLWIYYGNRYTEKYTDDGNLGYEMKIHF